MIWFGSSAGVALANMYPEAKSAGRWLVGGWHVAVAYVVGFFVMLVVLGWHPDPPHKKGAALSPQPTNVATLPARWTPASASTASDNNWPEK
jgi:hypothetical protein